MKAAYHLLVFCTFFCIEIISMNNIVPTPENTEFYFDIDEVVIEKGSLATLKIVLYGLMQDPLNSLAYIKSLLNLKNAYHANSNGIKEILYDNHGNTIEGATFHFLQHGLRDHNLMQYVPTLLTTIEQSRRFIPGTRGICNYLKDKGYLINFATNKDHISYQITAENLGHNFTSMPSKVFVAHPGNSQNFLYDIRNFAEQPTTHPNYQTLAYHALNIQASGNIIHAPGRKPEASYYQCLLKNSSTKKFAIFVDDIDENGKGFKNLQNTTNIKLHGIHFKNPVQLVDELVNIGILSEQDDYAFLQKYSSTSY